ncbi:MAG: glycosyltransferase [Synergistaceae bacterium]|jgi:glycosyltransferase involved in cell wall biosynthesis|nr:glycosyltransferase [Synergistaceae bacterium]
MQGDSEETQPLNIIHILPELEEGGVERLVPVFANIQSRLGHKVCVVSNGGRLESLLSPEVEHIKLPVHRKNPFVGIECAMRLAPLVRRDNISIIHAHSRIPAWVSYFTKVFARRAKFIYSAHARFSTLNYGSWAISRADGAICVSRSVRDHMRKWLPRDERKIRVIYNSLPGKTIPWRGSGDSEKKHLLFVGRISDRKKPITLVEALAGAENGNWTLDMLGDGPLRPALEAKIRELGLEDRVFLRGFSNTAAEAFAGCDLFLFPSQDEEGLPLVLIEAFASGAPVIASDISSVRELTAREGERPSPELLPVGDVRAWRGAIERFLEGTYMPSLKMTIKRQSAEDMVGSATDFYREILK